MTDFYTESPEMSEYARREYSDALINLSRTGFPGYRTHDGASELVRNFGAPLNLIVDTPPTISQEYIGCDGLCEITRLRIQVLPELPFYGLLFVPKFFSEKLPLVVASNGHLGTPELMYGMHGKNGYSDLTKRILRHNVAVFSPQFLLWNCGQSPAKPVYETAYDRAALDRELKKVCGGITAVEVFCLLRSLVALSSNMRFLDMERVAACGMSYGAFLTLRAMAVSEKIRCGYFMACIAGGLDERFPEWFLKDKNKTPSDGELMSMCAPRPVFAEVGAKDDIFELSDSTRECEIARNAYRTCKTQENFHFNVWDGAHIVNPADDGISFMINAIK
ncbi:MAG: hypothetical protein IKU65_06330 [Oscillospiraceae bacterium]|nr:hypothetical protein [Oscillospiraceae bacterium]